MNAEATPTADYFAVPEVTFANTGDEFEKTSEEQLKEMWDEALERVSKDKPQYIMRLDKKTLIKTEAELALCQEKNIALRYGISHAFALHLLKEEDARGVAKKKRRTANKKARASRKRNNR